MNPVLILLILIGAVLLWFVFSNLFRIVGGVFNGLADNAKHEMYDNKNEEEDLK